MEMVEIVIRIPKKKYEEILEYSGLIDEKVIKSGIVLPKVHGRLIDADAAKCSNCGKFGCENSELCSLYNAQTIIEAGGEGDRE